MKKNSFLQSDESGEIMIESTIVVLITTFVLFFLISLGFILYQKSLVNTVANETAAEIAQSYKYYDILAKDINSKSTALEAIDKTNRFRYLFFPGNLVSSNESKTETYTLDRLSQTSLATAVGEPTVTITTEKADMGRRYIEVKVEAKYTVFLGQILDLFGMDTEYTMSATSYAECIDVSNYCNTVRFAKYAAGKINSSTSFASVVSSIADFLETTLSII